MLRPAELPADLLGSRSHGRCVLCLDLLRGELAFPTGLYPKASDEAVADR